MPEAALASAAQSSVDFEFVVERDGSLSAIRMVKSSGTASRDRAAAKVLADGRFLPLPEAYPDANLMVQATFVYVEANK
jgi:TonB family protein